MQRARHVPALRQMLVEFAARMTVGRHKSVLGALGLHIDGQGSNLLDSVAMVNPAVAQTVESCVYRDGGDLASWRLPADVRIDVIIDLCAALQHIRSRGVVALDLRPENIALGDCVGDTFSAAIISVQHAFKCGHVLTEEDVHALAAIYTAPPVKAGDIVQPGMDSWALGVFTWEMIMGFKPVTGLIPGEDKHSTHATDAMDVTPAASSRWMFAKYAATDAITRDTLTLLFRPHPQQRPSPVEVHQWMGSVKRIVGSQAYQEIAAAAAEGAEVQEPSHVDLTKSTNLH